MRRVESEEDLARAIIEAAGNDAFCGVVDGGEHAPEDDGSAVLVLVLANGKRLLVTIAELGS